MAYQKIKGMMSDGKTPRYVQVDSDGRLVKAPSVSGGWKITAIPKGGTTGTAVDLGGDFEWLQVELPALDSCTYRIQTCRTMGGTFQDLYIVGSNGEFVGARSQDSKIGSVELSIHMGGWRYVRLYASAAQTTAEIVAYVRGITF